MRVLRRKRDWRGEAVVKLVDAGVKRAVVQQAVAVVEEGLAQHEGDGEVSGDYGESGQRGFDPDEEGAVADFLARGLFGAGLELVAGGEGWGEDVEEEEEERGEPEGEELDGESAEELNGWI
ncbi:conserved hypothetical protein [Uncinocarpus reesii 1704]|uniref:Uncharacterized protein n=1 Tax=Uncinocarpus reesii (strain UAMH 1704) TaxID=336963 RepID=C4JP52_UNCRE|nr:uncharacterized protein UREG_03111 [Uncinocarpus reesii 1704]EEP78266.1 conserved hypothetical protein [Uncinocarpus reesii 1704]